MRDFIFGYKSWDGGISDICFQGIKIIIVNAGVKARRTLREMLPQSLHKLLH